jgi:serine protease Do
MNEKTGVILAARFSAELAALAARVRAAVVRIATRDGFGAGTVWRADGAIVTNHHVARRETAIVLLRDGRRLEGRVAARDVANDLALLRVAAAGLPALPVRDARALRPGELVLAVGHPAGMADAATLGIVTETPTEPAPGRRALIRTDVLLRPGNSGGPLVDAAGRVVGINAMVAGGAAFSVPSYLVERLVRGAERPALGVVVRAARLPTALAARSGTATGLVVMDVGAGSAAERAGLLVGDLLLALDGQPLPDAVALQEALAGRAGDDLALLIARGDAVFALTLRLPGSAGFAAA